MSSVSYESDQGQMIFQKNTLFFVVICLDYCCWRAGVWQTEQNKEEQKVWTIPGRHFRNHIITTLTDHSAVSIVQTGSTPPVIYKNDLSLKHPTH